MTHHNRTRILKATGVGTAVATTALLLSACGMGAGSASGGSGSSSTASAASASSGAAVLGVASVKLGTILVDRAGRTIYFYQHDKGGTSFCKGACATNWLPVRAPASIGAVPGVTARLGMTKRSDGSEQLTVAGHPVYTFVGDKASGQTKGQNLDLNGGLWYAVSPGGRQIEGTASASSAGGGYGY